MSVYDRYWDLKDNERAALSEEDVRALCRVELMEQGILEPKPVERRDVNPPELEMDTYYHVDGFDDLLFSSAVDVEAFLLLKPFRRGHDYRVGYGKESYFAQPLEGDVVNHMYPRQEVFVQHISDLEQAKEAREANQKAQREFESTMEAVREATGGIWEDWHRCRNHVANLQNVRDTFHEYLQICNGNWRAASVFLEKVHDRKLCREALGDQFDPEP